MLEALETIGNVLGDIANFLASIPRAVASFIEFIYTCISECGALLVVIPQIIGTLMVSALIFSIVLAIKRLVID